MKTVPAIIPLSILEAVRTLDAPAADGLEVSEHAPEVARRLGLNATVAAQIGRYSRAAERAGGVALAEVVQVFRLVARRPDAALVFADAGRRAARYVARRNGRGDDRPAPTGLARRFALRRASRAVRGTFAGELDAAAEQPAVRVAAPLSVAAAPDGAACAYYASAFSELLRLTTGFEGTMIHEACRGRGDSECRWRAVPGDSYE
jgi:predicted hydrocarbon binding protein